MSIRFSVTNSAGGRTVVRNGRPVRLSFGIWDKVDRRIVMFCRTFRGAQRAAKALNAKVAA